MVAPQINLSTNQKELCSSLVVKMNLRVKSLRTPEHPEDVTLDELRKLIPEVEGLKGEVLETFSAWTPISSSSSASFKDIPFLDDNEMNENDIFTNDVDQMKPVYMEEGKSYLTITVDKIGLKDASILRNPFLTISIKDGNGFLDVVPSCDTPITNNIEGNYVLFRSNIQLPKSIEDLPKNFIVFFEFKHYKVKKHKISTKCFSFIDKNNLLNDSSLSLDLYKKPTDFRRKNLNLLTTKPLYLHLSVSVIRA